MAETSQFVDEATDVLHTLQLGRASALSSYLFQRAMEDLGPGNPQICGPLRRGLISPDDVNVRLRILEMIANTGQGWVTLYGPQFADDIVLSIADSNVDCAASACRAVQQWTPAEGVKSTLLSWAKGHVPGHLEAGSVQPAQLPSVKSMIQDLPDYAAKLDERRNLPSNTPSMENNVRLFGKFKGTMMSVFNRG